VTPFLLVFFRCDYCPKRITILRFNKRDLNSKYNEKWSWLHGNTVKMNGWNLSRTVSRYTYSRMKTCRFNTSKTQNCKIWTSCSNFISLNYMWNKSWIPFLFPSLKLSSTNIALQTLTARRFSILTSSEITISSSQLDQASKYHLQLWNFDSSSLNLMLSLVALPFLKNFTQSWIFVNYKRSSFSIINYFLIKISNITWLNLSEHYH